MVPSSELSSHRLNALDPFRGSPRRRVIHIKTAFGFAQMFVSSSSPQTAGRAADKSTGFVTRP